MKSLRDLKQSPRLFAHKAKLHPHEVALHCALTPVEMLTDEVQVRIGPDNVKISGRGTDVDKRWMTKRSLPQVADQGVESGRNSRPSLQWIRWVKTEESSRSRLMSSSRRR